nr:SKP1-like protein 1B [Tanacetum cinerariifolium]
MMEDGCAGSVIPVPNITSKTLSKVVDYLNKHGETPEGATKVTAEDLKAFDAEFVDAGLQTLFNIILAASYLNIKTLLKLVGQAALDMTRGQTMEHIFNHLYVKNDETPDASDEEET